MGGSPLDLHAATARDLQERIRAEQRGAPFLLYRDGDDRQVVVELAAADGPVTIGRGAGNTIELSGTAASRACTPSSSRAARSGS